MGQKWQGFMHTPIYEHTVFGHNSLIFHPISNFKTFLSSEDWYLKFDYQKSWVWYFCEFGTLGPKMVAAARLAPNFLGPQKIVSLGGSFGSTIIFKCCFWIIGARNPPLKWPQIDQIIHQRKCSLFKLKSVTELLPLNIKIVVYVQNLNFRPI